MFEYTALVDAPVQRFTGIVTGAEPLDEQAMPEVQVPAAPILVPVSETPVMLVAVQLEPAAPQQEPSEPAATRPAPAAYAPRAGRPPVPRAEPPRIFVPRAQPAPAPPPGPSIVPALVGIAAAGITAFLWLRRDGHGRGR